MKPNEPGLQALNDGEIARRALKLLAERKMVPTPETFAEAYWECAGVDARSTGLAGVLKDFAADLVRQSRMSQQEASQMVQAAQRHQWNAARDAIGRALARRPGGNADSWPALTLAILKQSDALHANWTRARKLDSIARVIDGAAADPAVALDRLRRLVESWGPSMAQLPNGGAQAAAPNAEAAPAEALAPAAAAAPAEALAPAAAAAPAAPLAPAAAAAPDAPPALPDPAPPAPAAAAPVPAAPDGRAEAWRRFALRCLRALEQACIDSEPTREKLHGYLAQQTEASLPPIEWVLAVEREVAEQERIRGGLQRLLAQLCENLVKLAPEEAWLGNLLEPVRALLGGSVRPAQIAVAERRLSILADQQSAAHRGLHEAKVALTEVLAKLLERIGAMDDSTEKFDDRVGSYQQQLQQSPDVEALARIVHGLLADTRSVRDQIASSRTELAEARKKVSAYEARVSQLEHQLSEVSTLVQKDPLTNALNRRGLEQAFRTESARAQRYDAPLTLAMMDLDNFKQVNDRLGHVAGDRALIHFVTTVHATMRPTDLTARSGGEEFAVLFPACSVKDGAEAVERLQRELARRPFQFDKERLVLTFSAGVAEWKPGETLEQVMQRADASLYAAKRAGKNRVLRSL